MSIKQLFVIEMEEKEGRSFHDPHLQLEGIPEAIFSKLEGGLA
jgi:hypothetical protein